MIFSNIVKFPLLFSALSSSFLASKIDVNLTFMNSSNCLSLFFLYISNVAKISSSFILFIFFGFTLIYILSTKTFMGYK